MRLFRFAERGKDKQWLEATPPGRSFHNITSMDGISQNSPAHRDILSVWTDEEPRGRLHQGVETDKARVCSKLLRTTEA